MKKKNKCVTKKKERLIKFYTFVGSLLFFYLWFPAILLSYCIAALVSCPESLAISLSYCVLAPAFYPGSPTILLFYYVPTPVSCLGSLIILLSCCIPALAASVAFFLPCYTFVSYCGISALLLLLSILGLPLFLGFCPLRIFKQSLLNKFWPCSLTSLTKLFCPFPAFDAYNLDNNNGLHNLTNIIKLKRGFNTAFINSCSLIGNHD